MRIHRRLNVGIKHQSEFLWLVGCKYGNALEPLKTIWLSFLTAFTWTCATRHAVRKTFEGMKAPIYELELKTTFPDSWKTTSQWSRYYCTWIILLNLWQSNHEKFSDMERCDEKSCHCVGPFYSFGNYEYWNELEING